TRTTAATCSAVSGRTTNPGTDRWPASASDSYVRRTASSVRTAPDPRRARIREASRSASGIVASIAAPTPRGAATRAWDARTDIVPAAMTVRPADLVIRDVRIVDGSGGPASDGDVEVRDGRITAVGTATSGPGTVELDGKGRFVCAPGFVDTHTHDDAALIVHPDLAFKVAQGCTTVVIGNCGFSGFPATGVEDIEQVAGGDWVDLEGFGRAIAAARPALNAMALVGHNTLRIRTVGKEERRAPSARELATMREHVDRAMDQGACGLSTGLIYEPGRWSQTEEIVELARAAGAHGGLYATHMRNEGDRLLEAVDEALRVGDEAGCAVHISHHKAGGRRNWGKVRDSLAKIDVANAAGADVTLDFYPYTASSGPMIEYFDLDD